jgi:hypothetical protein
MLSDLVPQDVGAVNELVHALEKSLRDLASLLHSVPQLLRKLCAVGQMAAETFGKVRAAGRAAVGSRGVGVESFPGQLVLPKAPATGGTLGDRVIPAIHVQEHQLFGTRTARVSAVDVHQAMAVGLDGVTR